MTDARFTPAELDALERLGWEFMPYGPTEWGWIKFDDDGHVVGQGGDDTWERDLRGLANV